MNEPEISAGPDPDAATVAESADAFDAFDEAASGVAFRPEPLRLRARDGSCVVIGMPRGRFAWGWLAIAWLFVRERARGKGVGSALLARAARGAALRGCTGCRLDTVRFQAPGFYRRQGDGPFGRLDGIPAGHARTYFEKRLAPSGPQNTS